MIVLIGSQKGGTGKTTVAVNLAVEYARQGLDVCLVDADRQRSAARWHGDREEHGHEPKIAGVEKLDNISSTLTDLDKRYDVVVVDVAGHDSREMRSGMSVADHLVAVLRPSQLDLDTLEHMSEVVQSALDINPKLRVHGLLNAAPTNPSVTDVADAAEYLDAYPLIPALETVLHERKAFRDVIVEGLGVVEFTNKKAAAEVVALTKELMS